MPRGQAEHDGARDGPVVGDHGADQAAGPARGEGDCLVEVVVGRAPSRPVRTVRCRAVRSRPRVARSSTGDMKAPRSASASTTSTVSGSPKTSSAEPRSAWTALRTSSRWSRLASAPIRTSSLAGLPTVIFVQPRGDRVGHVVGDARRHDDPADRGALLAGLDGHLGDDALHEQVELRVVGGDVGAEHRAVQRVGLDAELDPAVQHGRVLAQVGTGRGGAGEGDGVLGTELLDQAGGAAAEQLQGALRQQAGLDDPSYDQLGEVRRLAGRLHDGGHAGQERGGELLQEAPDREVERVDLDGDPGTRGVDVPTEEGALPTELFGRTVEDDRVVGQLAGALGGEGEDGADAAVDVDRGVAPGRAGARGQLVELVLELGEVLGRRLEQPGALVEAQRPQGRATDRSGVVGHRGEIDPGRGDPGHLLAGRGVEERGSLVGRAEPASGGIAFEKRTVEDWSRVGHVWQTNTRPIGQ